MYIKPANKVSAQRLLNNAAMEAGARGTGARDGVGKLLVLELAKTDLDRALKIGHRVFTGQRDWNLLKKELEKAVVERAAQPEEVNEEDEIAKAMRRDHMLQQVEAKEPMVPPIRSRDSTNFDPANLGEL